MKGQQSQDSQTLQEDQDQKFVSKFFDDAQRFSRYPLGKKLIVYAPPGTGKTTTISKTVVRLINDKRARPQEMLLLTFMRKASVDMLQKVKKRSSLTQEDLNNLQKNTNTFHKFAMNLLGVSYLKIINQNIQKKILKRIIFENPQLCLGDYPIPMFNNYRRVFNIHEEKLTQYRDVQQSDYSTQSDSQDEQNKLFPFTIYSVQRQLNYLFNNNLTLEQYQSQLKYLIQKQKPSRIDRIFCLKIYKIMEIYLIYLNNQWQLKKRVSFGNIFGILLKKLKKKQFDYNSIISKLRYLIIDQFQDLNKVQLDIITQIIRIKPKINILMVGDPDQNIYSWRGAIQKDIQKFINNSIQKSSLKRKLLRTTYRLHQGVYTLAQHLLKSHDTYKSHPYQGNDALILKNQFSFFPVIQQYQSESTEARVIVQRILQMHLRGIPYSKMAILCRNIYKCSLIAQIRKQIFWVRTKLKIEIPISYQKNKDFVQKSYLQCILLILDYILFVTNRQTTIRLLVRLIPSIGLFNPYTKIFIRNKQIHRKHIGYVRRNNFQTQLQNINRFVQRLQQVQQKIKGNQVTIQKACFIVLQTFYHHQYHKIPDRNPKKDKKIYKIIKIFEDMNQNSKTNLLKLFVKKYSNFNCFKQDDFDLPKTTKQCVLLQSIHKAKGLQYDCVFLPSMNQMPYLQDFCVSKLKRQQNCEQNQQLRVIYTGVTRAKYYLFISRSKMKNNHKLNKLYRIQGHNIFNQILNEKNNLKCQLKLKEQLKDKIQMQSNSILLIKQPKEKKIEIPKNLINEKEVVKKNIGKRKDKID